LEISFYKIAAERHWHDLSLILAECGKRRRTKTYYAENRRLDKIMTYNHIGLTISESSDIRNFYQNILGMELQRNFVIDNFLAKTIFGLEKELKVYSGEIGNLKLELFTTDQEIPKTCNHICLSVSERDKFIGKIKENGYECIVLTREMSDLVFVKDKSGNLFEIKEEGK
jgi:catechol 2,3-dioxygenase-like lactoylglutathione lyase family enzyme